MARDHAHGTDWTTAMPQVEPPPIVERLAVRLSGGRQPFRPDLSDQIEAVFHEACLTGDLLVAADLLRVLEMMEARAGTNDPASLARSDRRAAALGETLTQFRRFHAEARRSLPDAALSDAD